MSIRGTQEPLKCVSNRENTDIPPVIYLLYYFAGRWPEILKRVEGTKIRFVWRKDNLKMFLTHTVMLDYVQTSVFFFRYCILFCERNFIIYTDLCLFKHLFVGPDRQSRYPVQECCRCLLIVLGKYIHSPFWSFLYT